MAVPVRQAVMVMVVAVDNRVRVGKGMGVPVRVIPYEGVRHHKRGSGDHDQAGKGIPSCE